MRSLQLFNGLWLFFTGFLRVHSAFFTDWAKVGRKVGQNMYRNMYRTRKAQRLRFLHLYSAGNIAVL